MTSPKDHKFKRIAKGGRKGNKGQTKMIRIGSRNPGASQIGSIRHPY